MLHHYHVTTFRLLFLIDIINVVDEAVIKVLRQILTDDRSGKGGTRDEGKEEGEEEGEGGKS